jgi:hypothetical protein
MDAGGRRSAIVRSERYHAGRFLPVVVTGSTDTGILTALDLDR